MRKLLLEKWNSLYKNVIYITIKHVNMDNLSNLIAIPSFARYTEIAKKQICNMNTLQLEKMYHSYLTLESADHLESGFVKYREEYGQEICPDGITISYVGGEVKCNLHDEESGSDDDASVPYL